MPDADVLIVGAGLAGLRCAQVLHKHGVSVLVLEASDGVGGRVRTDIESGFRLDRGFQVMLTAYPEAKAALDYDTLGFQAFYNGALVWYGGRFRRVADPFRGPVHALATLVSPIGSLADKVNVGRLRTALMSESLEDIFAREEVSTEAALRRRWGFSGQIIDRFFRPFLGGVFLDRSLRTSSRMFEFVFRMFAEDRAVLPANGMGAIPEQLASSLPSGSIRLNTLVTAVTEDGAHLTKGDRLNAQAIVVATDAPIAAQLFGHPVPPKTGHGVSCFYYAAPKTPLDDAILVLNGEGKGPINNLAVLSNISQSYAPPGLSLVSVSVLDGATTDRDGEPSVREQLRDWFGDTVDQWDHLRTYTIDYALPDQASPFLSPVEKPVRVKPGLYACGDYLATASINGALTSGRRAAEAVLEDLAIVNGA